MRQLILNKRKKYYNLPIDLKSFEVGEFIYIIYIHIFIFLYIVYFYLIIREVICFIYKQI
jgi:hypothetical protein